MLNTLKFLIWTGCAVGLGLYLSTVSFGGKSTVELVQQSWKQHGGMASLTALVKEKLEDALGEAKGAVPAAATKPKEQHSPADRDAVNKLIATQGRKG
jgi:hypothetical protein